MRAERGGGGEKGGGGGERGRMDGRGMRDVGGVQLLVSIARKVSSHGSRI